MMSPRRLLAISTLALSPLLLAGCEQPSPGVTVWSGTNSVHEEAVCWQPEGQALTAQECAENVLDAAAKGEGIPRLEVRPGNTVGISVDRSVAAAGWSVQIAGQTLAAGLNETYHRFTFPENVARGGDGYTLQVIAAAQGNGVRGHWFFQLVPA